MPLIFFIIIIIFTNITIKNNQVRGQSRQGFTSSADNIIR